MLAACIWSLFLPSLAEMEKRLGMYAIIPIFSIFLVGAAFMVLLDCLLRRVKLNGESTEQNVQARKLFFSMAVHNIPEGLALGFAFGSVFCANATTALVSVLGLAIGIGIQNIPEGAAVSLPLRASYNSRIKAFRVGLICAGVEPLFALIGYFFANHIQSLQTWLLAFSAGAIFFVSIEELIPAAKREGEFPIGSLMVAIGFIAMTAMDMVCS